MSMRSPLRVRFARASLALGLAFSAVLPAAVPAVAAEKLVLRVGTTQDLDSMNPFQTALVVGYEALTLNYDLLVNFGPNLEPSPGFAASWSQSADGTQWTFKMRPGMTWSDGQPATAEDARFTFQLILDAVNKGQSVGLGYIDPDIKNAGITKVEAPDPETLVLTTNNPTTRILQMYAPVLPKHVWAKRDVANDKNDTPVVGTGPYQAVEWKTGQYVRFVRNPHYWGTQGAADEVFLQFFKNQDTMVQALKSGELDYAAKVNAEQFNQLKTVPNVVAVAGTTNGFTELGFNTYGKDIKGGGASTKALRDPAFRDALGYAIDKQLLVDKVLGGYGQVGTTQVPPFQTKWHVEPNDVRAFSIDTAKQKLDAAGYVLNGSGQRLDKEGKPLNLRLFMPDSDANYPKSAQFIKDWFSQLGIKVTTRVLDSATLITQMSVPEAGAGNKADYDLFIWAWTGSADPNSLLLNFTTSAIGSSSDSNFSNPQYDALFAQQNKEGDEARRHDEMAQLQQLMYDQAPYHILYYDGELDAYRTDRFSGWQNQPVDKGVPLFGYGSLDYTLLTDAKAVPSPSASSAPGAASAPAVSAAPSAGQPPATPASTSSPLPLVLLALAAALIVLGLLVRRRRSVSREEE